MSDSLGFVICEYLFVLPHLKHALLWMTIFPVRFLSNDHHISGKATIQMILVLVLKMVYCVVSGENITEKCKDGSCKQHSRGRQRHT